MSMSSMKAIVDSVNSTPEIPDRIKDLVIRLTMDDPAAIRYILQVILTMNFLATKEPMPLPFGLFEENNPFGITGEGAIMCGIDTDNKMLRFAFLPGDKATVAQATADMNKTRKADGMMPVEIVDTTDVYRA